jgi:hypothetical protein
MLLRYSNASGSGVSITSVTDDKNNTYSLVMTNQASSGVGTGFVWYAPANQPVYLQISNGGTSASSGTAPSFGTNPGDQTSDGDLIWLCLGSATWAATTNVTQWTARGQVFSAIKDSNVETCRSARVAAKPEQRNRCKPIRPVNHQ